MVGGTKGLYEGVGFSVMCGYNEFYGVLCVLGRV